jgi:hypothetical protein
VKSVNAPDAWVILRIKRDEGTIHKVLAGWYGGFAQGDSWKLNSGIEKITEVRYSYEILGPSGSVYVCHKDAERMSGLMTSVLEDFQASSAGKATVEVVSIDTILNEYISKDAP